MAHLLDSTERVPRFRMPAAEREADYKMAYAADCVNYLARLTEIPAAPKNEIDWAVLEEEICLRLPEDCRLLVEMLPDGWFRDFVRVLRPQQSAGR